MGHSSLCWPILAASSAPTAGVCVLGSREGWLYPESELLAQGRSDTQGDMVLPADGLQQIPVLPPYLEESQDLGQARPGERKRKERVGEGD